MMKIDTQTIVSITDANQNFSKVTRIVDQYGAAVILKNNKPQYILTEFSQIEKKSQPSDDELRVISDQLIKRNAKVYEELAK